MNCAICCDRGFVPFFVKQHDYNYEYIARCKCKTGLELVGAGFATLDAVFTDFELQEIKKQNIEKYANGGRK